MHFSSFVMLKVGLKSEFALLGLSDAGTWEGASGIGSGSSSSSHDLWHVKQESGLESAVRKCELVIAISLMHEMTKFCARVMVSQIERSMTVLHYHDFSPALTCHQ